jgi:hypothetical protein
VGLMHVLIGTQNTLDGVPDRKFCVRVSTADDDEASVLGVREAFD